MAEHYPAKGAHRSTDLTTSVKRAGGRTFELTEDQCKVVEHATFELTEDSKAMNITVHQTGPPTYVHENCNERKTMTKNLCD